MKLKQRQLARDITLALAGLSTLALVAPAAHAQAAATPPAAPASAARSGELTTITITANRRVEDQQKVGVSVTALTGEALAERNVNDLQAMEGLSPGFTFGRSGVDARPAMRGVRTENVAVNGDTTIGFFVDGIYKSRSQQAMLGFVDVERLEVQRGPQGTLFGRNTFGGNIVITTNAPQLRTTEGSFNATLGNYGRKRADGAFNLPLGDKAAMRLAAVVERSDGWVRNDFNPDATLFDQDLKYLRGSFRLQPASNVDIVLRADVSDVGGRGGSAFGYKLIGSYLHQPSCQPLYNATFLAFNTRATLRDNVNDCTRTVGAGAGTGANAAGTGVDLGIPLYKPGNFYRIDNEYRSVLKTKDRNLSAEASLRLSNFTLKSITGYADFKSTRSQDGEFSSSATAYDQQRTEAKTLSQEFQILSEGTGPLSYVAGVYLFKDELLGEFINQQIPRTIRSTAVPAPIQLPQNGAGFYDLQEPETESTAIYGQLSFRINEAFSVTGGLRYTRDNKSFRFANANSVLPLNAGGAPDGNLITLTTPQPSESAYGTAGTTNCTGSNAQPGFNCLPGTNTLIGATYSDATFSKTTGRLSADWRVTPNNLVYASLSNGFRSGGFNSGQALESARTFKPETVDALEIGAKNRFLNNTLQVNVAAFTNRYSDLQEQRQIPIGATTVTIVFNAAKARANGFELETTWRTTPALTLGGSLSLLDAKYTSFPDVALPFGTSILVADPAQTTPQVDANGIVIAPAGQRRVFAPGYDCRVLPGTGGTGQPAATFGCDLSGKRVPYSPERQLSAYVKYDFDLGGWGTLTPLVQVNYSSGFFGQAANAEAERQPAYTKADLKLNWRIKDTLSLQAFVDNATDKQTLTRFVWGGG
ncbi:MAG TPA: TonB-dependent receptor, partial [Rubrivivax sp.]|nr:TonB-dependent receptor [Rubrivivax sp.]